ncbi:MAG: hypothetical protein KDA21_03105 [Phycisphaerales bacterium]|nr:hypothetical protein [Phycisphaerales bacterium]
MSRSRWMTAAAAFATMTGATFAGGSGFSITSYTIDCGGGTVAGGTFALTGVIGQPDVGPELSGGTFTLVGGFLHGVMPGSVVCPGDVDGSNAVNFADLEILLDNWSTMVPVNSGGDLNGDGNVNFADLEILLDAWGTVCGG